MDKQTALEKIKKCLALGQSANEHEAAAAMRQAQKLMELFGISQSEVEDDIINETYETDSTYSKNGIPSHLSALAKLISKAFGVKAIYERGENGKRIIRYFGQSGQVELAIYASTMLWRHANGQWVIYSADRAFSGQRNTKQTKMSFFEGFFRSVTEKIEAFAGHPKTEQRLLEYYKSQGKIITSTTLVQAQDSLARSAGAAAGREFSINRPISGFSTRGYLK